MSTWLVGESPGQILVPIGLGEADQAFIFLSRFSDDEVNIKPWGFLPLPETIFVIDSLFVGMVILYERAILIFPFVDHSFPFLRDGVGLGLVRIFIAENQADLD